MSQGLLARRDIDDGSNQIVYSGTPIQSLSWLGSDRLVINVQNQSRILAINSATDVKLLELAEGLVIGEIPATAMAILSTTVSIPGSTRNYQRLSVLDPRLPMDAKAVKRAKRLRQEAPKVGVWWIDGNGSPRLASTLRDVGESTVEFIHYAPESEEATKFNLKWRLDAVLRLVGFDSAGQLLALTNLDREFIELTEFDAATGKPGRTIAAEPGIDLSGVGYRHNNEVNLVRFARGGRVVERAVGAAAADPDVKAISNTMRDQSVLVGNAAQNGRRLVYVTGEANPGSYYIYEKSSKQMSLLATRYPHLDDRPFAKTERFSAKATDGTLLEAFLTRFDATSGKPLPLLVLPHGGPYGVFEMKRFDPEVQYFAQLGYAVLQVNYRGSGGAGRKFLESGIRQWGKSIEQDIDAAVSAALSKFPLDAKRIAIVGTSYGAYAAVTLSQIEPERYRAAVGIAGVYDLPFLFSSGNSVSTKVGLAYLKKMIGDPLADGRSLRDASPVFNARTDSRPLLLIHDRLDNQAPFEHSIRLQAAMRAKNQTVTLIALAEGAHGIVTEEAGIANYPKIAAFLREALSPAAK